MQHALNHELTTEIVIDAPADKVWSVLADFSSYPEWNPFVVCIQGELVPNSRLRVEIKPPGGRRMKFEPAVTKLVPGSHFSWTGRLPIPGAFQGDHRFEIWPLGENRSLLIHAERFSGLLVPLLKKSLESNTRAGFEAMNEAVKERAEAA
jgi:hypothetical protein